MRVSLRLPGLPSSVFVCVVFVRVIVRVFVRMIVHARVLVSLNRFLIALPRMQLYKVNRFASAGRGCMNRCARTRRRATEPRYREDDRVMRLQPTATCALAPDHPSVRGKSQPHAGRFLAAALLPALVAGVQAADCDDGALSSPAVATYRGVGEGVGVGRGRASSCPHSLPSIYVHPFHARPATLQRPSGSRGTRPRRGRRTSRACCVPCRGHAVTLCTCLCLPGHCPRLCPRLCTAIACTPVSTPAPFASAPAFSGTGPAPCGSASPGPRPSPARPPAASSAMELSDSRRQESARGAGGPLLRRRARLPRQAEESVRDNVAPRPPPATRAAAWRARSRRPPKRPPQGDLGHVESATTAIEGVST